MYSYPIYGGSNGATNEWEFDLTVYKACIDNNLSSENTFADINYDFYANGVSNTRVNNWNKVFSYGVVNGWYDCSYTRVM